MFRSARSIASLTVLFLAALIIGSCSGQGSPTAPSAVTSPSGLGASTTAVPFVTTSDDETPLPQPADGEEPPPEEPPINPDPVPPEPAPAPPAPAPAPAPLPPTAPGWNPGPPPPPAATPPGGVPTPIPSPPNTHPRIKVLVNPEPVPYSGRPITDTARCRDLKHTWYYEQVLHTETGIPVTITERENFFDGRFVNKVVETIRIGGNGTARLNSRWCSGYPIFHYAQTRFKGKDDEGNPVVLNGAWVRLMAP